MKRNKFEKLIKRITTQFLIVFMLGCVTDTPAPTGTFNMEFTGDKTEQKEGQAFFNITPNNAFGVVTVRLVADEATSFRLSFFNPDRNQINIEPGTYRIVERLNENLSNEVVMDYNDDSGTYLAMSGEVRVGVVKPDQLKGEVVGAEFTTLNSSCSGSFDAIPE